MIKAKADPHMKFLGTDRYLKKITCVLPFLGVKSLGWLRCRVPFGKDLWLQRNWRDFGNRAVRIRGIFWGRNCQGTKQDSDMDITPKSNQEGSWSSVAWVSCASFTSLFVWFTGSFEVTVTQSHGTLLLHMFSRLLRWSMAGMTSCRFWRGSKLRINNRRSAWVTWGS